MSEPGDANRELTEHELQHVSGGTGATELQSLRLQMSMDGLSKMVQTMSNVMRSMARTGSQIVQNLK